LANASAALLGIALTIGIWQVLASARIGAGGLPTATSTFSALIRLGGTGTFWAAVWQTLFTVAAAFVPSVLVAVPIGAAVGLSTVAYKGSRAVIEVWKTIPPIVILPLVVLKAGASERMAEILIFFAVVPSLVVVVAAGVRDTDPIALDTARSFQINGLRRVRRVVVPGSIPFVVTALRISISFALVTAVLAEIEGGAPGLGYQLNIARSANRVPEAFALVAALGLAGLLLRGALNQLERRIAGWHVSVRRENQVGDQSDLSRRPRGRISARGSTLSAGFERVSDSLDGLRLILRVHTRRLRSYLNQVLGWSRRWRAENNHRSYRRPFELVLELGVPALLLVWWWAWSTDAHNIYFPPAGKIVTAVHKTWFFAHFQSDVAPSLYHLALGLLLAVAVGLVVGVAMAELPFLGAMLDPIIALFRSIPGVAYIPILILLIGYTDEMRITSIAVASSFPVMIATVDGLRGVDPMIGEVGRAYGVSSSRRLFCMRLPAAAPRIAAGIEVAIALGVSVMVASELQGTSHGIGAQTILAQGNFDIVGMWSGIVLLAIVGVVASLAFRALRIRLLRWYYQSRPNATIG
jgi:ABC-type nitrate/sulfonate/bicarbonate transport system permease component